MKLLIIFAATKWCENLDFFLREAFPIPYDYELYLVFNDDYQGSYTPPIPCHIIQRENKGYDFAAWGHVLREKWEEFTHFILLNETVRGPYNPPGTLWVDRFLGKLRGDTCLVGTTINTLIHKLKLSRGIIDWAPHVQSQFLAMNRKGMRISIIKGIFHQVNTDKWTCVANQEIRLSLGIMEAGYNIDCLLQKYQDIDWRELFRNPTLGILRKLATNSDNGIGDVNMGIEGYYHGKIPHVYEISFVKTNRYPPSEWQFYETKLL